MAHARSLAPAFLIVLLRLSSSYSDINTNVRHFPKDFSFGVSTAAYQIEGGWNEGGKGENIWDSLTHDTPYMIKDHSNGDIACNSYHLYKRDVEMLAELGVHYYRFSLSWSRILPTGFRDSISQDGIDYYNNLIDALIDKNIFPMVTLYHWDLPEPLQLLGGWTNPLLAEYFEDYARVVYENFGDRVKVWITFNEPKQVCLEGYGETNMAPALNSSGIADYMCTHTVLNAHANAYRLYETNFKEEQQGRIGITLDVYWAEPASESAEDIEAANNHLEFNMGWFANPIFSRTGNYPEVMRKRIAARSVQQGFPRSRLPTFSEKEIKRLLGSADFMGLNHYTTRMVRPMPSTPVKPGSTPSFDDDLNVESLTEESWPTAASSWLQVVPWGFRKVLNRIRKEYNNPLVIITENGYSTFGGIQDDERVSYMNEYLGALLDAIDDGCNVQAYTAWSLMDNFEWMKGYSERFGLYEVDFNSPNRTRTPRASAKAYTNIIKSNSITSNDNCIDCGLEEAVTQNFNAIII